VEIRIIGEYFLNQKWVGFKGISEKSLIKILSDNNLEDDVQIFKINIENSHYNINIQDNWSNCGIIDICNFGFNSYTSRSVINLTKKIEQLKKQYKFSGNFLMGTINQSQKDIFGNVFEKCGWKITELFVNDNGGQMCYLITKKLFV